MISTSIVYNNQYLSHLPRELGDISSALDICICPFQIINAMGQIRGQLPILQYLTIFDLDEKEKTLNKKINLLRCNPSLIPQPCTNHSISEFVSSQLSTIISSANINSRYCGYIHHDDILYIFCQINAECKILSPDLGCFSLIDEIVNVKSSNGIPICPNVVSLFTHNPNLCFLYDTKKCQIERPIAGYTLCSNAKLNYYIIYGIDSTSRSYYINIQVLKTKLKTENLLNIGILRSAIFLSVCKIMPQLQDDVPVPVPVPVPEPYNSTYTYYPKILNGIVCMGYSTDGTITQLPLSFIL